MRRGQLAGGMITIGRVRRVRGHHSIARSSAVNVLGFALPAVVALLAIPALIRGLGPERFGLLTLAWAALGYFNVFNLGIGRALTQLTAGIPISERADEVAEITDTALLLLAASGLAAALALMGVSEWLVGRVVNRPELLGEARRSFYWLALGVPFVISAAAFSGLLEALNRFGTLNWVRVPVSVLSFVGPLVVIRYTETIVPVVALLVVIRIAAWMVYGSLYVRDVRGWRRPLRFHLESGGKLLRFGGWMTAVNAIVSLLDYLDRFVVGALISIAAVTYYATPQEIVMRVLPISSALAAVLFPAFAASVARDPRRAPELYRRGIDALFVGIFPLALILVAFSPEILEFWLGGAFAESSATVLALLAAGMLISSLSQVPSTYLQGSGRPDLLAKLLILELPLYFAGLYWLTTRYGIEGAAVAWLVRVAFDFVAMVVVSDGLLFRGVRGHVLPLAGVGLVALAIVSLPGGVRLRGLLAAAIAVAFAMLAWRRLLAPADRARLGRALALAGGSAMAGEADEKVDPPR